MFSSRRHRTGQSYGVVPLALSLCFLASAALGQQQTIADRVGLLGLDAYVSAGMVLSYSDGAEEEAHFYATEVESAISWYRETLGWTGSITMAVLNERDYSLTTSLPYPTPHTETATGFIIVAERIETHPGFELWDLEARAVNAAWAFHEIGHVIASDLGIGSANLWINELIANVVMAGYIRAERPMLVGYQSGMPPRFVDANRFETLAEFDQLYFAMGQLDYLWFHFHIARIADYLVSGPGLVAAVEGLRREFPAERGRARESIAETFGRLEQIRSGVTNIAGPLTGE